MKNKILLLAVFSLLLAPLCTQAATLGIYPSTGKTNVGKTFSVSVSIDPKSDKIYTAKTVVNFPADLLEVKSFTFSAGWLPLQQPGYDLIDNANGKLIKTGGYTAGLSKRANLGTITFYAKKAGTAEIVGGSGVLLLASDNTNKYETYTKSVWVVEEKSTTTAQIINKTIEKTVDGAKAELPGELKDVKMTSNNEVVDADKKAGEANSIELYIVASVVTLGAFIIGFLLGKKKK